MFEAMRTLSVSGAGCPVLFARVHKISVVSQDVRVIDDVSMYPASLIRPR
jgi:hypothetical protein